MIPSYLMGAFAKTPADAYVGHMFKALKFCIPTKSTIVPHGPDWLHEVKTTSTAFALSGTVIVFA